MSFSYSLKSTYDDAVRILVHCIANGVKTEQACQALGLNHTREAATLVRTNCFNSHPWEGDPGAEELKHRYTLALERLVSRKHHHQKTVSE